MQPLSAPGLALEPLTVAHADEMFPVLAEPRLYEFLGYGPPPSAAHLRHVYAQLERRVSPDGAEGWLNWVVRLPAGTPIGFVQATLVEPATAWVAFVFASRQWGKGLARAATAAMIAHLEAAYGCRTFLAIVEQANARSIAMLTALSFQPATPAEAAPYGVGPTECLLVRHA
ncbi:MAG: GNAT family N-acetyltransferase [Betaproteobacteria bacterium]|nr:GNAT family N-acetyltransferase [Betaproteobacteria bacterium]